MLALRSDGTARAAVREAAILALLTEKSIQLAAKRCTAITRHCDRTVSLKENRLQRCESNRPVKKWRDKVILRRWSRAEIRPVPSPGERESPKAVGPARTQPSPLPSAGETTPRARHSG